MSTYQNGHLLSPYVAAAFPAVAVATFEEDRLTRSILTRWPDRQVLMIASRGGLCDARTGAVMDASATFPTAFAAVAALTEAMLIVLDWEEVGRNAPAYRALKQQMPELKRNGSMVIFIAPAWNLPDGLKRDVPVLDWALPTREQLIAALLTVTKSAGLIPDDPDIQGEALIVAAYAAGIDVDACVDAAAGLTLGEAENAFSLSYVTDRSFQASRVLDEKMLQVKRSGFLEVFPAVAPDRVGGLQALKDYFRDEVIPAKDDVDLRVRGVLLVGVPGTGKSLASKAAGAMLGWPVLRLDISALKGSLVGQSEQQMRQALALAEAVAPCVLWIDEVEKAVGGHASSAQTDGGTTLGMIGHLLTWLQEHQAPILTVMTCNDYSKLPAELTRAGRIDERLFVDLPTRGEREEIAAVHLARFGCEPNGFPAVVAGLTDAWTGAEIEQLVKSAARRTRRQITHEAIVQAASEIKPISKVRAAEIKALREWAQGALRLANSPAEAVTGPARKLAEAWS